MHFSFTGRDGSGKYAKCINHDAGGCNICSLFNSIDINPLIHPYTGDVIRYQQDWFILAAGFSIGTLILSPFSFEISFHISPITYCIAKDEHIGISTFRDFSAWGLFIEPGARVSFSLNRIDFSLEFTYRYIGKTKGPAFQDYGNTGYFVRGGDAGAGFSAFNLRIIIKQSF